MQPGALQPRSLELMCRLYTSSEGDTDWLKYISEPIPDDPAARIFFTSRASEYAPSMASNVSGKVAFVTGGASGIGAALATKLVDGGAEVWIADRQVDSPQDLAQRLNSGGAKAHAVELDVRSYPSFERAVAEAVGQSGRIDYLFNNAGILVEG